MAVVRAFSVDLVFKWRLLFRRMDFRFVTMVEKRRGIPPRRVDELAKVVSGATVVNATSQLKENRMARQKSPWD